MSDTERKIINAQEKIILYTQVGMNKKGIKYYEKLIEKIAGFKCNIIDRREQK